MLARTRCEAAEIELRGARQQLTKLREQLKRATAAQPAELGTEMLAKLSAAVTRLSRQGFRSSVLAWRRQALRSGVAQWAVAAQLMGAREVEAKAMRIVEKANSFARAEAAAANPHSPEAWLREMQRGARVRRLGNYFDALRRSEIRAALDSWRLATCAIAAEDDLRDVASRLRAAQAGMVKVLDGRTASEEVTLRQAALARCLVGVASLHGVRRVRRERHHSLQLGFKPWVMFLMANRLEAAAHTDGLLQKARDTELQSSRRAEALNRELQACRSNLAASQKRAKEAVAQAESAAEAVSKSAELRERSEQLSKLARSKAEGLEREKYKAAASARSERQQHIALRKGVVALEYYNGMQRRLDLGMAHALARWATLTLDDAAASTRAQQDPARPTRDRPRRHSAGQPLSPAPRAEPPAPSYEEADELYSSNYVEVQVDDDPREAMRLMALEALDNDVEELTWSRPARRVASPQRPLVSAPAAGDREPPSYQRPSSPRGNFGRAPMSPRGPPRR